MRTLSVSIGPDGRHDLDGTVVDGIEALRQRVEQAIRFVFGEWFLAADRGLRRELVQGHQTTLALAAATLTGTIRDEGGDEVTAVETPVVALDFQTREMTYSAVVHTIYGDMPLNGVLAP